MSAATRFNRRVPDAPAAPRYPIRAVSRITGLSVDTLRAWERRYQAVTPVRSPRGRAYTDADLARLRRLAALVARGHAIGAIAHLPDPALDRLMAPPEGPRAPWPPARADLRPITAALDRYDVRALERTLNQFAAVLPPQELIFLVVLPLLQLVGRLWEEGDVRPPQEHLVSSTLRSVLGSLLRILARSGTRRRAVFATLSGERHELGLLCASVLAAIAGIGVVYLGPDLPADEIVDAARQAGADIVVLGMTAPKAVASREVQRLARLPPTTELLVGGPAAAAARRHLGDRATFVDDLASFASLLENRR